MTAYEAKVKTKVGELTIHFDDKKDLQAKLKQVADLTATIESELGGLLVKESEKVIPGLESVYSIEIDGSVKLLKYPEKKRDILRLASFVSSKPLKVSEMKQITGIDNPLANMGTDFMRNSDDTYTLNSEGRTEVSDKIIPSLLPAKPKK